MSSKEYSRTYNTITGKYNTYKVPTTGKEAADLIVKHLKLARRNGEQHEIGKALIFYTGKLNDTECKNGS